MDEGRKDDQGKLRMDLISPDALKGMVGILNFGSSKYNDRNWEKGISFSRVYGAALRHLISFWDGHEIDEESGKMAIDHAQCCLHFLSHYLHNRDQYVKFDDRPAPVEAWKTYPKNNRHEVSNMGNVRQANKKSAALSQIDNGRGYLYISTSNKGIRKKLYIHRMVLETFIGDSSVGMECNHINGIKGDNRLKNLEWITRKQNIRHAIKTGLMNNNGERNPYSKLTNKDIKEIRKLRDTGSTLREISNLYHISISTVSRIYRLEGWKHIT